MKYFVFLISALSPFCVEAQYQTLIEQFPEAFGRFGSWKQGEIEIATSPAEIKKIEDHTCHKLIRKGFSIEEAKQYSRVGIVAEDQYWIWIRDAVIFPGGIKGTYNRIIRKTGLLGHHGAVVFPVLENNNIVLNVNFRHATRTWELELPRGNREQNETVLQTASRELKEETGYVTNELVLLGKVSPETGMLSGVIPVYFGRIKDKKSRHQDESEAIEINVEMSLEEVQEAFVKGYIVIDIKGRKTKVFCRDPFLSYALLQAMLRKLI